MSSAPVSRSAAMRFIVALGIVSLFADVTYEGARSITGPFLNNLGASAAAVGFVVGLGEFVGYGLRLASGVLADRTQAYWTITILGYFINLAAPPLLGLAGTWQTAVVLIVAERAGKSLRSPARDVLLSEAAQRVGRGWGFGLHSALDQTGAVIGPLFVAWAVARANGFAPALLDLGIPAACALAALFVARSLDVTAFPEAPALEAEGARLPRRFWIYSAAAGLLALGYVDFPIVAYHFQKTALVAPSVIPLLYALAMGTDGLTALFFGKLYDRYGLSVLSAGILVSLLSLPLNFLGGMSAAIAGVACWGVGMGAMDAVLRAGISQIISMDKRGRAYGVFNAAFGVMWLVGSSVMGLLYDRSIPALVAFGVFAQLAAAASFFLLRRQFAPPRLKPE